MKTIRQMRHEHGWTQTELAELLGVTQLTVSNWERRVHEPSASQVQAIARLFGVSMDDVDFEATPSEAPPPGSPGGGWSPLSQASKERMP